jgi:AbrB family looped-hinge helix DNA binding protein
MILKRPLGEKGQVVIPKAIREMLELRKGEQVVFDVIDDEIKLTSEKNPEEIVDDFFDTPKLDKKYSAKELKNIIYEQYEEEIP